MNESHRRRWEMLGWILFTLCSLVYLIQGIMTQNPMSVLAAVLFFLGCIAFLVPLF